ncbi:MAG TPA: transglutaminase family protein [Polyangiaceae bacterium]|nr:transglutaminase family protein [Polyangiaceae bacterium]
MASSPSFLAPTAFIDSDHPRVIAFAREACGDASNDKERATRLFRAVRDRFRYDPYTVSLERDAYRASAILDRDRGFCITKAIALCAAARAVGIPARLGFADVRNHLASEKLLQVMRSNVFAFHGYVELWIGSPAFGGGGEERRALKACPAFNAELCARFGVAPLEFDGEHDAMLQAFDGQGRKYMEYLKDRGLYVDFPFDEVMRAFAEIYGGRLGGAGTVEVSNGAPLLDLEDVVDEVFQG